MRSGSPAWRDLADATPVALVVLDATARIVHANSAMVGLTGRRAAELVGAEASSLISLRLDVPGVRAAVVEQRLGGPTEVVEVPVRPLRSSLLEPDGWSVLALLDLRREAVLEAAAATDHLTGLPNRAGLAGLVGPLVARAAASGALVALAFLDVDGLKGVNDALGHEAGDALLAGVASGLRSAIAAEAAVGARIGGDEFVVLAAAADEAAAGRLVARLRRAVADPGTGPPREVSVGLALAPAVGFDLTAALADADAAMYDEKRRSGRRAAAAEGRSPTERRSRPDRHRA